MPLQYSSQRCSQPVQALQLEVAFWASGMRRPRLKAIRLSSISGGHGQVPHASSPFLLPSCFCCHRPVDTHLSARRIPKGIVRIPMIWMATARVLACKKEIPGFPTPKGQQGGISSLSPLFPPTHPASSSVCLSVCEHKRKTFKSSSCIWK